MREWEKNIRRVVPYVPGEQSKDLDIIKLNTNENPYPPSPLVEKALLEYKGVNLRKYPDAKISDLVDELAKYHNLNSNQVFVGVGSDDVLGTAFLTFFNSSKPIFFPDVTYSFYDVWADLYRIPYEVKPLDGNFRIIKEDYYKENGGVVLANPNAPTSIYENTDFVEDIIKHNQDVIVIVDEAYIDFGGKSAMDLISKYENLLIVRTFSKSRALAGLRIGYAMGNEALIKAINDVKYSYNSYTLNSLSIVAGIASVKDEAYFEQTRNKVIQTRDKYRKLLLELGFTVPDSKTNFLFASHNSIGAKDLYEMLYNQKIFVRYFNKPRIDNFLRITVGTEEEMSVLLNAITKYMDTCR